MRKMPRLWHIDAAQVAGGVHLINHPEFPSRNVNRRTDALGILTAVTKIVTCSRQRRARANSSTISAQNAADGILARDSSPMVFRHHPPNEFAQFLVTPWSSQPATHVPPVR